MEARIGWDVDGTFQEQIYICQDIKTYSTLWTKHTLRGASIDYRDIGGTRPGFRRDVRNYPDKRFFPFISTDTLLNEYKF